MTRLKQLESCKFCLNRTFSPQKGIICKITNAKASFINSCEDYSEDTKTKNTLKHKSDFKNRIQPDYMFGLDYLGIKNGVTAGIIVIGIGLTWLLIGVFTNGLLYFRPIILIFLGLVAVLISSINKKRRVRREL